MYIRILLTYVHIYIFFLWSQDQLNNCCASRKQPAFEGHGQLGPRVREKSFEPTTGMEDGRALPTVKCPGRKLECCHRYVIVLFRILDCQLSGICTPPPSLGNRSTCTDQHAQHHRDETSFHCISVHVNFSAGTASRMPIINFSWVCFPSQGGMSSIYVRHVAIRLD